MDFITKFPRIACRMDSKWVIVDRFTKRAHFIPIQERASAEKLTDIYILELVAWYGVSFSMVSDKDV